MISFNVEARLRREKLIFLCIFTCFQRDVVYVLCLLWPNFTCRYSWIASSSCTFNIEFSLGNFTTFWKDDSKYVLCTNVDDLGIQKSSVSVPTCTVCWNFHQSQASVHANQKEFVSLVLIKFSVCLGIFSLFWWWIPFALL